MTDPVRPLAIEQVADLDASWPEISPLLQALHEHHVPLVERPLLADWEARHRAILEDAARSANAVILLGRVEGRAVAFSNGHLVRDPGVVSETYGFIDNVFVEAAHRRTGVAQALTVWLETWFAERGAVELQLSVLAANAEAVEAWRALGFADRSFRLARPLQRPSP